MVFASCCLKKNLNTFCFVFKVEYFIVTVVYSDHGDASPVLSTCPLHSNSGCGKERRMLIGPW